MRVGGHVFPLLEASYSATQVTDRRGRVIARVRRHPVELLLDVPRPSFLEAWAYDAHKRLPADVVFRRAAGSSAWETLRMAAAYCVEYSETFYAGDDENGAYVCRVVLADPDGWTLHAGDPAAYAAPAARDHGVPQVLPYSGGRGPNGLGDTIGTFSSRPFDSTNCGGPILNLSWQQAAITAKGIATVIQHTSRFEADPANAIMIKRLQAINASQLAATDWDKRYYTHELREYERYRKLGVPDGEDPSYEVWNDAHTATLEDYQLSDFDAEQKSLIYHPDALL